MGGFFLSGGTTLARIPFEKVALGVAGQLAVLKARGMIIPNEPEALRHLEYIGYYRLSGYTHQFKIGGDGPNKENFHSGTSFATIIDRYIFDRKLRLLVMDAVERIEISLRSALSNSLATRHGPHWYLNQGLFACPLWFKPHQPVNMAEWHAKFIEEIKRQISHDQRGRGRDIFIKHYYEKYSQPDTPPCWMIFEAITFGTISQSFKFLVHPEYQDLCQTFRLTHQILSSWMHAISYVRNLCAHHSRLWNRIFTIKPVTAKQFRADLTPNDRLYSQLIVMQILLGKVAPNNHWAEHLAKLLDEHNAIPLRSMGFPTDWKNRPIWRL